MRQSGKPERRARAERREGAVSSSPWSAFRETAEAISATSSRLEKARILGQYLADLDDPDLVIAARCFSGDVFPLKDERRLNVGGAAILAAIAEASGREIAAIRRLLVHHGDLGDVAGDALSERRVREALTLADAESFLHELGDLRGSGAKKSRIAAFLARMDRADARFLVKLMLGDLRIGLKEGAVEDAIARLCGRPVHEIQWANMLTGDIGETALMARHDRLGEARMRLFHPIKFMLASPTEDLSDVARQMPPSFAVEDKFDGIRAQAHISEERVAIYSRTLDEVTRSFPDLVAPLRSLALRGRRLILDGEIVPMKDGRILSFQHLQKRLGRKAVSEEILAEIPAGYVVFDVLHSGERVLLDRPYSLRREVLEGLPLGEGESSRVIRAYSTIFDGIDGLDGEFARARSRNNEGLMVKDPASTYKPGRRGREWLKIKRAEATLDVVVTSVEVGNGRRRHLLSDFTFAVRASAEDPTLLNVGKAYSGLTDQELERLSQWFREHTLQEFAHGKVRIVEPKVVIEVTFDQVQPSKRHKGGFALRFPRILRIRDDKSPDEIDTLDAVRKLVKE